MCWKRLSTEKNLTRLLWLLLKMLWFLVESLDLKRKFSKNFKCQRKSSEYCRNSIYLPKSIAFQCQQKNFRDSYSWKRHVDVNRSQKYGFPIFKKFFKVNYLISSSNESLWLSLPSFEHDLVCHQSSCKVFPYA